MAGRQSSSSIHMETYISSVRAYTGEECFDTDTLVYLKR